MSDVTHSSNFDEMTSEQKEAFFATIGVKNPSINPEGFEFFAFVVDGKVAALFTCSKETMQDYINAWSSNPTIVKLTDAQKNIVFKDWNYDEQTGEFSEPESAPE